MLASVNEGDTLSGDYVVDTGQLARKGLLALDADAIGPLLARLGSERSPREVVALLDVLGRSGGIARRSTFVPVSA